MCVAASGIVFGNNRWCDRKWVDDVGVDGRSEPLTLPVAGDMDLHDALCDHLTF